MSSTPTTLAESQFFESSKPLKTSRLVNKTTSTGLCKPVEAGTLPDTDQENASPFSALLRQLSAQTSTIDKSKARSPLAIAEACVKKAQEGNDAFDVSTLRMQLEEARDQIVQMGHELTQQRRSQRMPDSDTLSPNESRLSSLEDADPIASGPGPSIMDSQWNNTAAQPQNIGLSTSDGIGAFSEGSLLSPALGWNVTNGTLQARHHAAPQPQYPLSGHVDLINANNFAANGAIRAQSRQPFGSAWNASPFATSPQGISPPITPLSFNTANGAANAYQPRPIGSNSLSAFRGDHVGSNMSQVFNIGNPWNVTPSLLNPNAQHYVPPVEPINYRRLLDRNTSCNWSYIVEKIVCNNDQQASIFLQQKLKVSTPEQKFELVEAIIAQAYPLMINRFGNFLVQRCFEHGTADQVIAIANSIRGKTLDLSMDAFGCHVVQKAFDIVPEEYKALMVHELLRRIPETVVHRYACHVWQKLFELRWNESPPQIMKYVNEALKGMWHEVALGETGSLVVQNIFENCLEEDKRPCIEGVLSSIDIVSHGQFGNWCIQHICEHGAPADKRRATEHVLRFATEYSTDQFASKVVEKCLKVGASDFLNRYLEKVCEGRPDRPRMPLVDIAGDQYGNYLIQYILINAEIHHRELVAQHVRKHMVSLRGSKFGSRVAMLCANPAIQTRPGPPSTMPINSAPLYATGGHVQPHYGQRMAFGLTRQDFR